MLSEELQGSFTASCHTFSLSPSAHPLSLSPDRSINHSVTETVTQSACKVVQRKCDGAEGFCSTADRPHLITVKKGTYAGSKTAKCKDLPTMTALKKWLG